jgi:hypothetical protein
MLFWARDVEPKLCNSFSVRFFEKWDHDRTEVFDPGTLATAERLDANRSRLPETGGLLDTAALLPADLSAISLDGPGRLLASEDAPLPLPRPRYWVNPDREHALPARLLETGMATLVPESSVAVSSQRVLWGTAPTRGSGPFSIADRPTPASAG